VPNALTPYIEEVQQQAHNALDCRRWMAENLTKVDALPRRMTARASVGEAEGVADLVRHFWIYAQALLTSSASISLIFWPSPRGPRDLLEVRQARALLLRTKFGVTDSSPLASRELRDHFAHYDERLDAWASDTSRRTFVDGNIGPVRLLPASMDCVLRHYDPETDQFIFFGTEYGLGPIMAEVRRIADLALDDRLPE
jgi:hypothetical protein